VDRITKEVRGLARKWSQDENAAALITHRIFALVDEVNSPANSTSAESSTRYEKLLEELEAHSDDEDYTEVESDDDEKDDGENTMVIEINAITSVPNEHSDGDDES
jgi:hypothetical protein